VEKSGKLLEKCVSMDWIRGKSQPETMINLPSNIRVSCKFSHHPIL
jgi:hypothetical protein